jgi:hypothetical protein
VCFFWGEILLFFDKEIEKNLENFVFTSGNSTSFAFSFVFYKKRILQNFNIQKRKKNKHRTH